MKKCWFHSFRKNLRSIPLSIPVLLGCITGNLINKNYIAVLVLMVMPFLMFFIMSLMARRKRNK